MRIYFTEPSSLVTNSGITHSFISCNLYDPFLGLGFRGAAMGHHQRRETVTRPQSCVHRTPPPSPGPCSLEWDCGSSHPALESVSPSWSLAGFEISSGQCAIMEGMGWQLQVWPSFPLTVLSPARAILLGRKSHVKDCSMSQQRHP